MSVIFCLHLLFVTLLFTIFLTLHREYEDWAVGLKQKIQALTD